MLHFAGQAKGSQTRKEVTSNRQSHKHFQKHMTVEIVPLAFTALLQWSWLFKTLHNIKWRTGRMLHRTAVGASITQSAAACIYKLQPIRQSLTCIYRGLSMWWKLETVHSYITHFYSEYPSAGKSKVLRKGKQRLKLFLCVSHVLPWRGYQYSSYPCSQEKK